MNEFGLIYLTCVGVNAGDFQVARRPVGQQAALFVTGLLVVDPDGSGDKRFV